MIRFDGSSSCVAGAAIVTGVQRPLWLDSAVERLLSATWLYSRASHGRRARNATADKEFLNESAMITPTTSSTQLLDTFALAKAVQESSTSNAPLMKLDPEDPNVFWTPGQTYHYELTPVSTPDERAALRGQVLDTAGAGKL
jgi:hypothetical protein